MTSPALNGMLPPGSRLGILGGGQLGRMLALAAAQLGYRVQIYSPEAQPPASLVAAGAICAAWDNEAALEHFAATVDAVTYEFENIPLATVRYLESAGVTVHPSSAVLAVCQHRMREKAALQHWGIPTAEFLPIEQATDLARAMADFAFPAILKTAESGYDGKGQRRVEQAGMLAAAWHELHAVPCILEALVPFRLEISVLVARSADGDVRSFDPVHNLHRNHILDETHAPAPISSALAEEARRISEHIAQCIALRGLLAVELFVTGDDRILVNELAPRPHNSGHWTMEACMHDQFDQCARAVLGLPLGDASRHSDARMKNLIGEDALRWAEYLADPNANLHLYGKREIRPGRKMGHVTWLFPRV